MWAAKWRILIKIKSLILILFIFAGILLGRILFNGDLQSESLSIKVKSTDLATPKEKDSVLKRYISKDLLIENAEFEIFYQDNSKGLVPGPSDWDIVIIGTVSSEQLESWKQELNLSDYKFQDQKLPESLTNLRPRIIDEKCYGAPEGPKFLCYSNKTQTLYVRYSTQSKN